MLPWELLYEPLSDLVGAPVIMPHLSSHCKKCWSSQYYLSEIGKHKVSNNRYSKFKNCLRTQSFLGFHNWEFYREFYVFNRFLTSSPDWNSGPFCSVIDCALHTIDTSIYLYKHTFRKSSTLGLIHQPSRVPFPPQVSQPRHRASRHQ